MRHLTPALQRINHTVVKAKFFFFPGREESLLISKKVRDRIYKEKKKQTPHQQLYFPFIVHWDALHNTAVCLP